MATQTAPNPTREKMLKGLGYQKSGEIEKAQRCYKQVLKKLPNNPDALHLLGVTYRQLGYPKRAIEYIQKAIAVNPNQAPFYANLARAMMDVGTDAESMLAVSEKALSLNPQEKEALNIRGIALTRLKRTEEAEEIFQQLLVTYPDFGDAYRNYGLLLRENEDFKKALAFFHRAVQLNPDNPENYIERSRCRLKQKDFKVAEAELADALERFPDHAELKHETARLLFSISRTDVGVKYAEEAVAENPKNYHRLVTLAVQYLMLGRGRESVDTFLKAKKLAPEGAAGIDWNLSLAYLSIGDLTNGWALHDARFGDENSTSNKRKFDVPEWGGEDISGKTVLAWCDQGLGDALRGCTMLHELIERAGKVILEVAPKSVPWFQSSFPKAAVRAAQVNSDLTTDLDDFDLTANLVDIAKFFRPDFQSFRNARTPAFSFDIELAHTFFERLKGKADKPIVGIGWRSRNLEVYRARYYLSAPEFFPIIDMEDVTFVNLQYLSALKEIKFFEAKSKGAFVNFEDVDLFDDLEAAAALTACCDLVVSANVSVTEISGVLDVPTIRFGPQESALLLGQKNVPWHPSTTYLRMDENKLAVDMVPTIRQTLEEHLSTFDPSRRNKRLQLETVAG
ncbi:tetratricopeptide repeat protein [Roseibium sp.]|uniref:tetratricopeptide repeat protein n=1 Tax=Roseibium sp. TaxID=1936156 RepID=UPI003BAC0A37